MIHALHTMMMKMTDVEEWGKIHTLGDLISREPGALRDAAFVFESRLDTRHRPVLGVHLT